MGGTAREEGLDPTPEAGHVGRDFLYGAGKGLLNLRCHALAEGVGVHDRDGVDDGLLGKAHAQLARQAQRLPQVDAMTRWPRAAYGSAGRVGPADAPAGPSLPSTEGGSAARAGAGTMASRGACSGEPSGAGAPSGAIA